jgi:hypothetical protein
MSSLCCSLDFVACHRFSILPKIIKQPTDWRTQFRAESHPTYQRKARPDHATNQRAADRLYRYNILMFLNSSRCSAI